MELRSNWSQGINNRADAKAMPAGTVRDAVNVDPVVGGGFALRTGFAQLQPADSARGPLAVGRKLLYADGPLLFSVDVDQGIRQQLAEIDGAGRLVGDVLNEELFFCTETETWRFDGKVLRAWGVPTVTNQPVATVGQGGLAAGYYQVAATFIDAHGDEGATGSPLLLQVPAGSSLQFDLPAPPSGGKVRLYVGPREGGALYLQFEGTGQASVSVLRDDTARLETTNLRGPLVADFIAARGGVLYLAAGPVLWFTLPFRPHLRDASRSFFSYPAPIDLVVAVDGGIYVCADKTYFLSSPEIDEPGGRTVFEHGAVRGTALVLPDGRAAWMTRYGLAIGDDQGAVALSSAANFLPEQAAGGSAGLLEHNGNQLVVTTLSPSRGGNPLAASDYYDVEIITP